MAKAEAAAKKLRDGLGDSWEPFEQETQRQRTRAPKQAEEVAGAFARSFSRSLEQAFRSLPKANITADSSDAQVQLGVLRQAMQDLSGKTIGVDINAAAALGELRAIQGELERLGTSADIDVRADAAAALSQLQSIQREVDRLGGETARVDVDVDAAGAQSQLDAVGAAVSRLDGRRAIVRVSADVSSALSGIATVGAALAAIPTAATIGLGVGALGGAFSAAGAGALGFAAVAGPSLGRVNEALKEAESSAGGAGGAMKSAAQKAAESAQSALSLATAQDAVADAADRVKDTQQGVKDALTGVGRAQADAAQAADDAAYRQAQAARRIEDAERSVADAHRATQRAIEDLTRARERAAERIEDLALATEGGALSEERAQLSIQRAQADRDRTNADPKASSLDKNDANLRLKEAEFALKRIRESNGDLAQEQQKSDAQGVEGSDEVTAAKERVEAATRAEGDAERAVSDARTAAARDAVAGARSVAEANERVAEAQRKVGEAQQDVIKAQRDAERAAQRLKIEQLQQKAAMEQAGGAAGGAATKMSKLSEAEQKLAKDIKKFKDNYEDWQKSLQADIFPVIRSGMDLMTTGMRLGTPLIKASAGAFNGLIEATNKGLQSQQWTSFFDDLTEAAPRAIEGLGTAAGNVAGGLAGIIQAFLPYTGDLMTWIEDISQKFEDWGQGLSDSQGFKAFVAYAQENLPKVETIVGNLGIAIGKILQAGADLGGGAGSGALDFVVTLSERLAAMDPAQVEAIAKGVGLVFAAIKLGAALQVGAIVVLADVLSKMSPGQIEAVALAIAGVVVAIKGYQAATAAIGFYRSLTGGIGAAGDAAGGATGRFAALGKAMLGIGAGVVVLDGVGQLVSSMKGESKGVDALTQSLSELGKTGTWGGDLGDQWSGALLDSSEAADRFRKGLLELKEPSLFQKLVEHPATEAGGLLPFFESQVDTLEEKFADMDRSLAGMVSGGNLSGANAAFAELKKQADLAGVPVGKLQELFPAYAQAVAKAGTASATAAGGIDAAKQKVDGLQKSMDTFAGRTDYMQAVRNMETAYKDATVALDASNGKLEVNARMTDAQKDAVLRARDSYSDYIQKVSDGATAQEKLSGKTGDATLAVADQLPKLFDLAGKSKEARDQVYDLAAKFGISREQADKATTGAKGLRDMVAELKSKQVKLDVDTKTAQAQLDNVVRTLNDIIKRAALASVGGLNASSARGNAWGGIQSRDGRPDYMADGGVRALGSNPSAMIARQPYHISGRGGPDVIFGESGYEAFIPLDSSKRDRGLQIMQEAAGIMGMAVVPEEIAAQRASGASGSSGGSFSGSGAAMVTVTGIDALRSSLDTTSLGLTGSLGTATNTLDATLGDTGTLTTSLEGVGAAAGVLAGEVTGWGEVISVQVPPLTTAVSELSVAVTAAAAAAKDAKAATGSKADEGNPRDSEPGYVAGAGPASKSTSKSTTSLTKTMVPLNNASAVKTMKDLGPVPGYIEGYADGGITNRPSIFGEAGLEAAVPLGAGKRSQGLQVLGQAAQHLGATVNYSRQSRPVQSSYVGGSAGFSGGGGSQGSAGSSQQDSGPVVAMYGTTVRSEADVDELARRVSMRRRGRG